MEFFVKSTNELSGTEREQLRLLFNNVFEKNRSMDLMLKQYTQNPLGYSYHSFFVDDGIIQGAITYVPSYYYYGNERKVFVNSIDTMIAKEYRDLYELLELLGNGYKALKEHGVSLVYGYPNDNSYPVYIKSKTMGNIGKMRVYCLPYRIGGIKKPLSVFNCLSKIFAHIYSWCSFVVSSKQASTFLIHKDDNSYNQTRYLRTEGEYGIEQIDDFTLYYKIIEHEDVRTAFIIDIDKKSSRSFCKSVRYLLKKERKYFDLILYPGYLPFLNTGMIRIPRKYEPKNFNFTAQILDKNIKKEDVFSIENWDTNLSNYDLL